MGNPTTAKSYVRTVALAFGARSFAVGSQFLVTVVLAAILGAGSFGDMIVVFAAFRLIALSIGTGLSTLIIYHVGRHGGDIDLDARIHRSSLLAGVVIASSIGLLFFLSSNAIADAFDKPGMASWIRGLVPYLIFLTALTISTGSYDGRSRVDFSIFIADFAPNFIQISGLALVYFADLGERSVYIVLGASVVLPAIIAAFPIIMEKTKTWHVFTMWDVRYASTYGTSMLASQQIHGIDLVLVGALFTSETAGAYAVCARLALLIPFVQLILLRKFTPAAGRFLANGDLTAFNVGLRGLKTWIFASVLFLSATIVLAFPAFKHFLGPEFGVVAYLIVLLPVFFGRACFGGVDVALKMSGRAGTALFLSSASATTFLLLALLLQSLMGPLSIGFGLILSSLFTSVGGSVLLYRRGIHVTDMSSIAIFLVASAVTLAALTFSGASVTPFVLGAILIVLSASIIIASLVQRTKR